MYQFFLSIYFFSFPQRRKNSIIHIIITIHTDLHSFIRYQSIYILIVFVSLSTCWGKGHHMKKKIIKVSLKIYIKEHGIDTLNR